MRGTMYNTRYLRSLLLNQFFMALMIWFQAKCRQHQLIKKTGRNRGKTYIYEAPPHVQYSGRLLYSSFSPISTVRNFQNFSGHRCHRRSPLLLSLSYLCLPGIRVQIKRTWYVHMYINMYICTYILKFFFQSAKRR